MRPCSDVAPLPDDGGALIGASLGYGACFPHRRISRRRRCRSASPSRLAPVSCVTAGLRRRARL